MKPTTLTNLKDLNKVLPAETKPIKNYRPRYQKTELSETQKQAYNRIIKGLPAYPNDIVKNMNERERKTVINRTNRAWSLINKLKQTKLNQTLNHILDSVFPTMRGNAVPLLKEPITDNNFICNMAEMSIPTVMIIDMFIREGLLPSNFLNS